MQGVESEGHQQSRQAQTQHDRDVERFGQIEGLTDNFVPEPGVYPFEDR